MSQYKQNAFIGRTVGIVCIALGFVIGIYGLEHPDTAGLNTALGLIATGMMAQGYALYCSLQRMREQNALEEKERRMNNDADQ